MKSDKTRMYTAHIRHRGAMGRFAGADAPDDWTGPPNGPRRQGSAAVIGKDPDLKYGNEARLPRRYRKQPVKISACLTTVLAAGKLRVEEHL